MYLDSLMQCHHRHYMPLSLENIDYQPNVVSNIGIQHLHQSHEFTSEVVSVHKCP
jgi:hypothetical protein